ncbi:MAG: hypothetical protein PHX86_08230, partial [Caldisericia bacterium]|nr:hypothetical protein [Caldisericia bacterium]
RRGDTKNMIIKFSRKSLFILLSALLVCFLSSGLDQANNWVTDGTETAQWMWLNQALRWLVS